MRFFKAILVTGFLLIICSALIVRGESRATLILCLLVYAILLGIVFIKDLKSTDRSKTKTRSKTLAKTASRSRRSQKTNIHLTLSYQNRDTQFVKQAKAYAKRRGKRAKHVPFQSYYSTYEDMSHSQQKWYFYWRDQVRQGKFPDTSLSYIFIHVYEVINNVGVRSGEDGARQLCAIWLNYRERYPRLDYYLAEWLLDYIAVNGASEKLTDILDNPKLLAIYSKRFPDFVFLKYLNCSPSDLPIPVLSGLINYEIQESKFYRNGYSDVLKETLVQVLRDVDTYVYEKHGRGIFEHFRPRTKEPINVELFRGAVYDGNITINDVIRVYPYSNHPPFQEYILSVVKYTENALRKKHRFRGRLKVSPMPKGLKSIIDETVSRVDQVIPEVAGFDIEVGQVGQKSKAIAIPRPKELPTYRDSKLQVISDTYLKEANTYASRTELTAAPAPLDSPFTAYSHDYRALSSTQHKWYFFWRNQVRQHQYPATDLAYIFIHAVELVHLIGVTDAKDAYSQLRSLWLNYREEHPQTEQHLLGWMISFANVYNCGTTPQEILTQPEAYKYAVKSAPDILLASYLENESLQDANLELLARFVDHDIQRSSFYTAGYEELMQLTIPKVLNVVNQRIEHQSSKSLFALVETPTLVVEVKDCWRASRTFRQWPTRIHFSHIPAYSQHLKLRIILTNIVKYSENKLRKSENYRGRLRVGEVNKQLITLIDQLFESEIQATPSLRPSPKIEIDLMRVEKLRTESDEVLDMLQTDIEPNIDRELIVTDIDNGGDHTSFEVTTEVIGELLPAHTSGIDSEDEAWTLLSENLDDCQLRVLEAVMTSSDPTSAINEVAAKHFLMPTILVDGINELAQDLIGDILIEMEPSPHLIDDYYEPKIMEMVAFLGSE